MLAFTRGYIVYNSHLLLFCIFIICYLGLALAYWLRRVAGSTRYEAICLPAALHHGVCLEKFVQSRAWLVHEADSLTAATPRTPRPVTGIVLPFIASQHCSDRLWDIPNRLSSQYGGLFPGSRSCKDLNVTSHVVPRTRIHGTIYPLPNTPWWHSAQFALLLLW
jgi:hypothetical protein